MKLLQYITFGLFMMLLPLATAFAIGAPSAQDDKISVSPVVRQFPVTAIGESSAPATFTISNISGADLSIFVIDLAGVNAAEFEISANNCPASLTAGTGCSVAVRFKPASKGTKSAYLRINSGSATTPLLAAFVTNSAGSTVEAQQRMPAVLSAVSIPEPMTAGVSYPLTWTLEGYHDSYSSYAVMFDCTGVAAGTCGDSYTNPEKFAESDVLTPTATEAGDWSYSGVTAKKFTYSWNFNAPAKRADATDWAADPGSNIVVRFYLKSDVDLARGSRSVSLLIPGNPATTCYDTAGRRIVKKIKAP